MPHQETGAAVVGICGFRQERIKFAASGCWSLQIVRRSSRPGFLLYELVAGRSHRHIDLIAAL